MRFRPLTLQLALLVDAYTVAIGAIWLIRRRPLDWLGGLLIAFPWLLLAGKVYLDWRDR